MRIVVTGANGQLGHDVIKELQSRGYSDVLGIDIRDLDITRLHDVEVFFENNIPNIIIHCAAYTLVDRAEDENILCMNVNFIGTKHLIEQARKYGAKFLYISTDYVFDGNKNSPYEVNDVPNPLSKYGESKYLGEIETLKYYRSYIVRISWVFGKNGSNFVRTMLRLGNEQKSLNVINDQHGSPTFTCDLSMFLVDLIGTEKYGIYHCTNEGVCSWYEFAIEIFRLSQIHITLNPISSDQYLTKARRPKNSVMSKSSLEKNGFRRLPHWKNALKRYLEEIGVI